MCPLIRSNQRSYADDESSTGTCKCGRLRSLPDQIAQKVQCCPVRIIVQCVAPETCRNLLSANGLSLIAEQPCQIAVLQPLPEFNLVQIRTVMRDDHRHLGFRPQRDKILKYNERMMTIGQV